jgi:hypothetical protein
MTGASTGFRLEREMVAVPVKGNMPSLANAIVQVAVYPPSALRE